MTTTTLSATACDTRRPISNFGIAVVAVALVALIAVSFAIGYQSRHVTRQVVTNMQHAAVQPPQVGAIHNSYCLIAHRPLPC